MPYNDRDAGLEHTFANEIKRILGKAFITKDVKADLKEATDFAIFTVTPFKIGVRLRRYNYFLQYPEDITIRWSRPSGAPTEIDKIRQGLVQFIMYGFVDELEVSIFQYAIVKAGIFASVQPYEIKDNTSHDSCLAAFKREQIPQQYEICFWQDRKYIDTLSTKRPQTSINLSEVLRGGLR